MGDNPPKKLGPRRNAAPASVPRGGDGGDGGDGGSGLMAVLEPVGFTPVGLGSSTVSSISSVDSDNGSAPDTSNNPPVSPKNPPKKSNIVWSIPRAYSMGGYDGSTIAAFTNATEMSNDLFAAKPFDKPFVNDGVDYKPVVKSVFDNSALEDSIPHTHVEVVTDSSIFDTKKTRSSPVMVTSSTATSSTATATKSRSSPKRKKSPKKKGSKGSKKGSKKSKKSKKSWQTILEQIRSASSAKDALSVVLAYLKDKNLVNGDVIRLNSTLRNVFDTDKEIVKGNWESTLRKYVQAVRK